MTIKDFYSDETKWCQHRMYIRNNNNITAACLLGALRLVYKDQNKVTEIHRKIVGYIGTPIGLWNDRPQRTFKDVKKLVEHLNI